MKLTRRIFLLFPLNPEYSLVALPLSAVDYYECGRDLRSTRVEHELDEIKRIENMRRAIGNRPWSWFLCEA